MGHAPPRHEHPRPGRLRERQMQQAARSARRRELIARIPPGAILTTGMGAFNLALMVYALVAGSLWAGLSHLLILLVLVIAVVAFHRRRVYLASPEGAEAWFERQVSKQPRDQMVMEWLPGLELELDYRLGLKQRPEPRCNGMCGGDGCGCFSPGGHLHRPTTAPPKPPDAAQSVGGREAQPRLVFLGPGERIMGGRYRGIDPEVRKAAQLWLKADRGDWAPDAYSEALAAIMQRVRDGGHRAAVVALYDEEPQMYPVGGAPERVCRCGHFEQVHTPFDKPQMTWEAQPDKRKCVPSCHCEGYVPVRLVTLDSHGMPSPARPPDVIVGPVVKMSELEVRTLGEYPPLPTDRSTE